MILTDLKQTFSLAGEKRAALTPVQTLAALDWLSNFHGFWWSRVSQFDGDELVLPPLEQLKRSSSNDQTKQSVWLNGGYTYLATRLDEFASLTRDTSSEWSSILTQPHPLSSPNSNSTSSLSLAEQVAEFLTPSSSPQTTTNSPISKYQTLIHGDVKSENLFTSASGTSVAFYDFQYVGLGLGVSDLAKFFTCSVPLSMLLSPGQQQQSSIPHKLAMQSGEKELLERYWNSLRQAKGAPFEYKWEIFVGHWEVALVDWLRFGASWGFWGNVSWLQARVRWILAEGRLRETLSG